MTGTKAASWVLRYHNRTVFPELAIDNDLADKDIYDNVVRINLSYHKLGPALHELFHIFGWDQAVLVHQYVQVLI